MKTFLLVLAAQTPFFLYMALVPPERRRLPRGPRRIFGAVVGCGAIGWGMWHLHRSAASDGKMWIGLGVGALLLTFAPLPRWLAPRDDGLY